MENSQNPSLDALLNNAPEPAAEAGSQEAPSEEQLFEQVVQTLLGLEASLANMNVGLKAVNARIETLERFVSYLLTKDPEAGPRMKEMAEKAEAAAKAQDGNGQ